MFTHGNVAGCASERPRNAAFCFVWVWVRSNLSNFRDRTGQKTLTLAANHIWLRSNSGRHFLLMAGKSSTTNIKFCQFKPFRFWNHDIVHCTSPVAITASQNPSALYTTNKHKPFQPTMFAAHLRPKPWSLRYKLKWFETAARSPEPVVTSFHGTQFQRFIQLALEEKLFW